MPRRAREKSNSGIYHVILRGANRQEIFHDDKDNIRFLDTLDKYMKSSELSVYGWCLMGNHLHLLVCQGKEDISITMKRIGVSYAGYYNWKYKSTGHLFQDRFKSEKIDNDKYLLAVIRYIHQNPVKAGLSKRPEDWKWSSCRDYYGLKSVNESITDINFILGMLSSDRMKALEQFAKYNELETSSEYLEYECNLRLNDEEAKVHILKILTINQIANFRSIPKAQRDPILLKVKAIKGISQRQAARILGISPNLFSRAINT